MTDNDFGNGLPGSLIEESDLSLLLRDQLVDAGGFLVQESCDGLLGIEVWNC